MAERGIVKSKPIYQKSLLFASLLFGLILVANLATIGFLNYRSQSEELFEKARMESELVAERIRERAQEMIHQEEPEVEIIRIREKLMALDQYVDSTLTTQSIVKFVEILDAQGNVVKRWSSSKKILQDPRGIPGGRAINVWKPIARRERHFAASPIPDNTSSVGSVRVVVPTEVIEEQMEEVRRDLMWDLAIGFMVSLVLLGLTFFYVLNLIRKSRRLEAEAQMADRLAYVGRLASGLAHEIRNPLNAMNVNLQMLDEELPPKTPGTNGGIRPLIEGTMGEIQRLNLLVSDFLDYARPLEPKLTESDINAILRDTLDFLRADLEGSRIRVSRDFFSLLPLVPVDPQKIRQALMNILLNAKQVLSGGGTIEVASRIGSGGEVRVSVRDDGPGIPGEDRDKIFQIFFTTKGGGTGMGLPIARKILESHGGSIEVESSPGEGTCFTMVLPRTRKKVSPRVGSSGEDASLIGATAVTKR